ncbi:hypothetical protein D1872_296240 [compost metagenome]
MHLDDRLGQTKTDADALLVLRKTAAIKRLEQKIGVIRMHPFSAVGYLDLHQQRRFGKARGDYAARGGMVDRIGQQIADGLQ